jgi:6-phosphogluconolactonase (cycloisomerase 2 family)
VPLVPIAGSPFPAGDSTALDLTADSSGRFVYAASHDAGEVTVLALDPSTGQLSVSSMTPSPGAPLAIALIRP